MRISLPLTAAVLLALTGCASAGDDERLRAEIAAVTGAEEGGAEPVEDETSVPVTVPTDLVDPEGSTVGSAVLSEEPRGVLLTVEVSGLDPGLHGMGLYETGACTVGPDSQVFASAGEELLTLPPVLVLGSEVGVTSTLVDDDADFTELLAGDGTAVLIGPAAPDPDALLPLTEGSRAACGAFREDIEPVLVEDGEEDLLGDEDANAIDRGTGGLEDDDEDTE